MSDAKFDAAFAKGDADGSGGISKFKRFKDVSKATKWYLQGRNSDECSNQNVSQNVFRLKNVMETSDLTKKNC